MLVEQCEPELTAAILGEARAKQAERPVLIVRSGQAQFSHGAAAQLNSRFASNRSLHVLPGSSHSYEALIADVSGDASVFDDPYSDDIAPTRQEKYAPNTIFILEVNASVSANPTISPDHIRAVLIHPQSRATLLDRKFRHLLVWSAQAQAWLQRN